MNRFVDEFQPEATDVALCGSMSHKSEWLTVIDALQKSGLTVSTPDLTESADWASMQESEVQKVKGYYVRRHIANIATANVVLVCNYEKGGVDNYIGSNTFLEMATGFAYEKPLYVLNGLPQQGNHEELLALEPIILNGDITQLIEEVRQ